jgi:hypothetical protein
MVIEAAYQFRCYVEILVMAFLVYWLSNRLSLDTHFSLQFEQLSTFLLKFNAQHENRAGGKVLKQTVCFFLVQSVETLSVILFKKSCPVIVVLLFLARTFQPSGPGTGRPCNASQTPESHSSHECLS